VAVEPGQCRERTALEFDDRDAQARRVEDELFQRFPTLRDDEQANCRSAGGEGLLDRAAARYQLLFRTEQVRGRQRGPRPVARVQARARPRAVT